MDPSHLQELQQAQAYLERLPPAQVSAVRVLLESMLDPVSRALAHFSADNEIDSEEGLADFDEVEAGDLPRHEPSTRLEELLAEFGLTADDWDAADVPKT